MKRGPGPQSRPWGLPRLFAETIRRRGAYQGGVYLYGFVAVEVGGRSYGAFQTKAHFRDRADLRLIRLAASRLRRFLEERSGLEVHMAFPGIGLGGLKPGGSSRLWRRPWEK